MQVNHTMTQLITERDQARKTAEYWKAEHNAANAEIARLRIALRDIKEEIDSNEPYLGTVYKIASEALGERT